MSITDQIRSAETIEQLDTAVAKLQTFTNASDKTLHRAKKFAAARRADLTSELVTR